MEAPLLSVSCITYNHKEYIVQAIESFLFQKTNFSFEIVIGEDCSNDGTKEIVFNYLQKYPDKIKVITSEYNVGGVANELRTLQACKGKYIALCEGDDYWNDPLKLQKQVDFLESNPEYGLVHGNVNHLFENNGKTIYAFNKINKKIIPEGNIFEELIKPSHIIKNMTVCFRKDLFEKYYLSDEDIMSSNWKLIDISIWLIFSLYSKIHYIDEVLSTYRLLEESKSRSNNISKLHQFHLMIFEIRFYFANKYNCSDEIKNIIKLAYYKRILRNSIFLRNKKMAFTAIINLIKMKKFKMKDFFRFIYHYFFKYHFCNSFSLN